MTTFRFSPALRDFLESALIVGMEDQVLAEDKTFAAFLNELGSGTGAIDITITPIHDVQPMSAGVSLVNEPSEGIAMRGHTIPHSYRGEGKNFID